MHNEPKQQWDEIVIMRKRFMKIMGVFRGQNFEREYIDVLLNK